MHFGPFSDKQTISDRINRTTDPVSYTHLDVYKRQAYSSAVFIYQPSCSRLFYRFCCSLEHTRKSPGHKGHQIAEVIGHSAKILIGEYHPTRGHAEVAPLAEKDVIDTMIMIQATRPVRILVLEDRSEDFWRVGQQVLVVICLLYTSRCV